MALMKLDLYVNQEEERRRARALAQVGRASVPGTSWANKLGVK
jgi:hypothetical protein